MKNMRICLKVATWCTVCSMFVMTVKCTDLNLTGDPLPVVQGGLLIMSCIKTSKDIPPLTAVIWYRNKEAMFQTVGQNILPKESNTTEYGEVSGRITVTTNTGEHKVMLQINSSLDDGSVWRCSVDKYDSNNLNVVVRNPTTVATWITTAAHHFPTDKSPADSNVYIIAGSVIAGVVTIFVLIGFAVYRMKNTADAVESNEEPEMLKGDHKEEESGNDKVMVDNVCYVGFVEVERDTTTETSPQRCASVESNGEPEMVKDDHKEEESGNDTVVVDNVCYVGFVEVERDTTTETSPHRCVPEMMNNDGD